MGAIDWAMLTKYANIYQSDDWRTMKPMQWNKPNTRSETYFSIANRICMQMRVPNLHTFVMRRRVINIAATSVANPNGISTNSSIRLSHSASQRDCCSVRAFTHVCNNNWGLCTRSHVVWRRRRPRLMGRRRLLAFIRVFAYQTAALRAALFAE